MVLFDVVGIKEIRAKERFDAFSYVSKNSLLARSIYKKKHQTLGELSLIHKVRNRDSRIYVQDKSKGLMFLSNTDISKSSYSDAPYMSKKFLSNIEAQKLDVGDLLTCAVGTIGTVCYVNKQLEGAVISGNILRFTPRQFAGFIYAFLQSRYGQAVLKDFASGSVQEFITPPKLAKLPVLNFSQDKQRQIHNLIIQSADLRVDANNLLEEAISLFEDKIGTTNVRLQIQNDKIKVSRIRRLFFRMDSRYQVITQKLDNEHNFSFEHRKISSLALAIFVGNRGKRIYVEAGVPFLSSSDMVLFNPKRYAKQISRHTVSLESMKVKKNDILISRSGTVGNVVLVGDNLENSAVSEHAIRLTIDESIISSKYVFCYLKTKQGKIYMEASAFGSVIITLNEVLIGNIDVPILTDGDINNIVSKITIHQEKLDLATLKENQAIQLVEKEIEQWQQ